MDNDKNTLIRASIFDQEATEVTYRQQMNLARPDGYAGELRGFYPESGNWNPPASRQGMTRSGGHKKHGGVDIFAPYIPFPCEVPVYAFASGRLEVKSSARQPDDNGNRIFLYPDKAGLPAHMPAYFILAHLNRFNGQVTGRVKAGDLIGFAGYSGNAGQSDDPPMESGALHINSGHVHFQIPSNAHQLNALDPLEKLGWKLRFDVPTDTLKTGTLPGGGKKDISGLFGSINVEDVKKLGVGKAQRDPVQRSVGLLRSDTTLPAPLTSLRKPTDPPNTLDYANRQTLQKTRAAYALATERFETITEAWRAKYYKRCSTRFRKDLKEVDSLLKAMHVHATAFKAPGPQTPGHHATALLRLLFEGHQVLYRLMGGQALAAVAAGSALPKKPGTTVTPEMKEAHPGEAPECGIGICGEAYAIALDYGVVALHCVQLREPVGTTDFKVRPQRTWSVSFGQGTEWHAVLDDRVFETEPSDLRWLAQGAREIGAGLRHLAAAACVCIRAFNEGRNADNEQDFKRADDGINLLLNDLGTLSTRARTLFDDDWTTYRDGQEVKAQKLLQLIARTSRDACEIALAAFDHFEGTPGFKPSVTRLWLAPP
jgi:hypothetical protein